MYFASIKLTLHAMCLMHYVEVSKHCNNVKNIKIMKSCMNLQYFDINSTLHLWNTAHETSFCNVMIFFFAFNVRFLLYQYSHT
jgi:hypothetical protein